MVRILTILAATMLGLGSLCAPGVLLAGDAERIAYWRSEWPKTDFAHSTVSLSDIQAGGPPRDGIPPIDNPKYQRAAAAAAWLDPGQPVVVIRLGDAVRAYPLAILIWHEIVNDTLAGRPLIVTYCPLCNSALAFDRRVNGRTHDFGTTGKLRNSDLVMWDRQTESWWQQMTGQAIIGSLASARLDPLPAPVVAFETFRTLYPDGEVLSRETGNDRPYGTNPYAEYESLAAAQPFLFSGEPDQRLRPMERVVGIEFQGQFRAYPFSALAIHTLVHDQLGGKQLVIFFQPGMKSVLDTADINAGRRVGTAAAFLPVAGGRTLRFQRQGDSIVDRETGSHWTVLGRAISGPLQGEQLSALSHDTPFAFAWLAFHPSSSIWSARQ